MYKLGEKVRSMYNGFLDSTYRPRDFQALSSPSTRTLQSAELFLAGLFPPTGFQVWNQDMCWQPIPIYPSSLDHYEILDYAAETSCPRFSEPQKDSLQEINRLYQSSLTSFVDYVIPHTGIDVMDVMQKIGSLYKLRVVAIVWETLKYVADNELPLPDWATKIYPEPLNNLFSKIFKAIVAGSTDQIKYLEGELFQELVGLMQAKANNTLSPDRRMYYYSGHDYTIMGLLAMLNPQLEAYVNPGSALIYELHQNPSTGQFTVQVLYIDGKSPDLNPQDIDIVGCESPLDEDNVDEIKQSTPGNRAKPALQLVIMVTRHGARGPFATFLTSQNRSELKSLWPYGPGELTQMYKLGEKIRSLYSGFLNQAYRPDQFRCFSTLTTHTLESAELLLAGLFPPTGFQVWNKDLLWQPVPVLPNFFDQYDILPTDDNLCPRFTEAQIRSLLEFDTLNNSSLTALVEKILPLTGIDDNDLFKIFGTSNRALLVLFLSDSLKILTDAGLPLPNWAHKIYPEPLLSLLSKSGKTFYVGSLDQIRYLEGLMQSKANNTLSPDRRMYYYSGHDYTIMGLLAMLNPQQEAYFNPGSALIYELHQNPRTGQFTVGVLYIDGASPDLNPQDIDIADCDFPYLKQLEINFKEFPSHLGNIEILHPKGLMKR
ncbi:mitochondrial acyl carrier protein [Homalodisca vitripennis]|nr:mitochondrial acyl carrier protein [Homalodisca vitripennis]